MERTVVVSCSIQIAAASLLPDYPSGPAASASFLVFIALHSIPTFDLTTNLVGFGAIALGVIPWALNRHRGRH